MRALPGLIPVVLFLILATNFCFEKGIEPEDSTYVSLRVAENLRTGNGLIFNAGERRDLIDSPLWIAMLTLVTFFQAAPLQVQLLGMAFGLLSLLIMLAAPRSPWIGITAALFLALDGLFISGATSGGSETLAAVYLVTLYPILRLPRMKAPGWTENDRLLAIWAGCATLVRYEFVLVAVPVALGAGLRERRRLHAWFPLLAAVAGASLVLGFRWAYYGDWPAYWQPWPPAAHSMRSAAVDLFFLTLRRPLLLVALGIFVSEWLRGRLWLGRKVGLAWGLMALLIFQLAPAEGQELERHVQAALPLAYLLAVRAIWRSARFRPALVAALLLLLAQPNWTSKDASNDIEMDRAYSRLGQYLRTHALPGTVVGAERVGALGFYSRLKMEDVAGRVSPRVANVRRLLREQGKQDGVFEGMLRQEPDLVFVLPRDPLPSSDIYVPNDDAIPEAIRGPFRVYRWAGSPVWLHPVDEEGSGG